MVLKARVLLQGIIAIFYQQKVRKDLTLKVCASVPSKVHACGKRWPSGQGRGSLLKACVGAGVGGDQLEEAVGGQRAQVGTAGHHVHVMIPCSLAQPPRLHRAAPKQSV